MRKTLLVCLEQLNGLDGASWPENENKKKSGVSNDEMPYVRGMSEVIYYLKKSGNKKVIYNTALVEEIIKQLKLDYSNCVSKTLDNVKIENWDEVDIAIISGSDTKGGEEDE